MLDISGLIGIPASNAVAGIVGALLAYVTTKRVMLSIFVGVLFTSLTGLGIAIISFLS